MNPARKTFLASAIVLGTGGSGGSTGFPSDGSPGLARPGPGVDFRGGRGHTAREP